MHFIRVTIDAVIDIGALGPERSPVNNSSAKRPSRATKSAMRMRRAGSMKSSQMKISWPETSARWIFFSALVMADNAVC
jgi:hypothetical protein